MHFYTEHIWLQQFVLLGLLCVATVFDLRTKRIPNPLILTGMVLGFLRMPSIRAGVMAVLFLILLFLVSMLHLIGHGDTKLWMVVSLFLGAWNICLVMLLALGLFLLFGFVKFRKKALHAYRSSFLFLRLQRRDGSYTGTAIPFAPFLLAGYLLFLLLAYL